jgi:hypothetical protein
VAFAAGIALNHSQVFRLPDKGPRFKEVPDRRRQTDYFVAGKRGIFNIGSNPECRQIVSHAQYPSV